MRIKHKLGSSTFKHAPPENRLELQLTCGEGRREEALGRQHVLRCLVAARHVGLQRCETDDEVPRHDQADDAN